MITSPNISIWLGCLWLPSNLFTKSFRNACMVKISNGTFLRTTFQELREDGLSNTVAFGPKSGSTIVWANKKRLTTYCLQERGITVISADSSMHLKKLWSPVNQWRRNIYLVTKFKTSSISSSSLTSLDRPDIHAKSWQIPSHSNWCW